MASTTRTAPRLSGHEPAAVIHWRVWPLVDHPRWSWLAVAAVIGAAGFVWSASGSRLLALAAAAGLAATMWQFFLPVRYEVSPRGLMRTAALRTRHIPWHAIRAYQLRPTGIVLYQRGDPTKVDVLRSLFIPYPPDEDETVSALREHLPHAAELPN